LRRHAPLTGLVEAVAVLVSPGRMLLGRARPVLATLSEEAPGRLRALLREAGVDLERPSAADVERTWQVMRRFAGEPAEDTDPPEGDRHGVLAQYGICDWGDGEHLELEMTRQFIFTDDDGEYSHIAQLHCMFEFEPSGELRALGEDDLWSFGPAAGRLLRQGAGDARRQRGSQRRARTLALVVEYGDV
jgi:hypothetical protein